MGHDVHILINSIKIEYPDLDLTSHEPVLIKLQEYFYRRYVVNSGSSISLNLIDKVDEFYFTIRAKIHSDIGLGTIDEIFIQKKNNWGHSLASFRYAYHQNNHFKSRPHTPINYMGPDNKLITENGQ
jgi:hypothetical protein